VFGQLQRSSAARVRVGVVSTREQTAIVALGRTAGRPTLEYCAVQPRGQGTIAESLRAAGFARAPVSAVLLPGEYQLAMIEAPDVLPAEMRAAVRWKLREAIDFHVDDAIVDVFDLPAQGRRAQGRMMYAVAARRSAVAEHAARLEGLRGFDVVDVPELCLRNLAALVPGAANGVALLYLGETAATVVLVRGTTLYLARHLDLEATLRFDGRGVPLDAANVALQLQRSLDYYESHYDQPPIGEIVVAPAGPRAAVLAQELATETGLRVGTFDFAERFECREAPPADVQTACFLAAGAALRDEKRSL
jgi:MSHA biogenesis protein MshI